MKGEAATLGFNSMIVRLKGLIVIFDMLEGRLFQFYDSPIKSAAEYDNSVLFQSFNSMIVRLKDSFKNARTYTIVVSIL